jgi:hypothetical protein
MLPLGVDLGAFLSPGSNCLVRAEPAAGSNLSAAVNGDLGPEYRQNCSGPWLVAAMERTPRTFRCAGLWPFTTDQWGLQCQLAA